MTVYFVAVRYTTMEKKRTPAMYLSVVVVLFSAAFAHDISCNSQDNTIRIKSGHVRGFNAISRNGNAYISFKGIPYARPPVGELRFREPHEPKHWNGVFDAVKEGNDCIQKNFLRPGAPLQGSEDCLYLNVFTHRISNRNILHGLRPVMVYIHGGGWFAGSSATESLGPDYFMDEDIVLVTLNYRLGVLGFLSTGDDMAPGNWALKDQLAAFKWVQDNIKAFGGNPNQVTIFGQSAGSASVHYHILSPNSKGLFHRAISESGSALNLWASPQNSYDVARRQARFVDCPDDNSEVIIRCLRKVDVITLTESAAKFKFWMVDPLTVFTPAVEQHTPNNPYPYLTAHPNVLIRRGLIGNPVPWIMGVVPKEGAVRAISLVTVDDQRNELNDRFEDLGPQLFETEKSVAPEDSLELFLNMTTFYMGPNKTVDNSTIDDFVDLYSDRAFIYGVYQTALLHAQAGHSPIFFYTFDYRGNYSWSKYWGNDEYDFGVCHCDDLIYLFRSPSLFPDLPPDHEDVVVSKKMVSLWTNFAKYGHPTPRNNSVSSQLWSPLPDLCGNVATNSDLHFYRIARSNVSGEVLDFSMQNSFFRERMEYWESLPIFENCQPIRSTKL